ncbi:hypothetical protein P168DRAFT_264292 [Aspergillus campestris IBT 28561]|uniref:DNA repair protein Rad1 n=1 Tax=Aspergillus campestris (strain IBT 28561) TaxID=1392248 RepID=A0A2I1DBR9_ASPC2|nr:uncharacterized protein P168DRAFT_264292 [Aspergillus campestris IBT 28561]PKY07303.1 hypothetical protein P168DRAFT_264292 [Aspergillus campestris IBT 28561]
MSLNEIWEAASASPYAPLVSKDNQFVVGFSLLFAAFILTGLFGLNRSLASIVSFGVPASLAFGFGAVFMICAVGVYPIFSAVSSNAHNLYTLLQCIGFASKATVQITPDGIRFSAEESRVVQGLAFLDKALFTSYTFNPPLDPDHEPLHDESAGAEDPDATYYPCFMVSLTALLETLKIFGVNDPSPSTALAGSGPSNRAPSAQPSSSAFTAPALLLDRSCTLQYLQDGSPLSITLSETGVKTTCDLTTYEPDAFAADADIPLQRDAIAMKIIMRSAWLHNAVSELSGTNPTILRLSASATEEPYFSLTGIGGPFSESSVEFSIEQHHTTPTNTTQQGQTHHKTLTDDGTSRARATRSKLAPTVTETFLVSPPSSMGTRLRQDYKFALVQKAARAMAVANKVSIRGDRQGVLSLQFMVEFDALGVVHSSNSLNTSSYAATGGGSGGAGGSIAGGGGGQRQTGNNTVSFVDFRFVPLLDEESLEVEEGGGFE